MNSLVSRILALLLLSVTATVCATPFLSTKLPPIQPYRGSYYDPTQGGSGLFVDEGANGSLFMLFSTFDTSGNQANMLTAGTVFTPSSEADRIATGIIGTATGQFYRIDNGQCAGCPYKGGTVTGLPIYPTFTWHGNRHVVMTFDGHTYDMYAVNYETGQPSGDEEFLQGTFAVSAVIDYSTALTSSLAIMRVIPAPFSSLSLAPGSASDVHLPPAGAHLYILQCAGSQDGADSNACQSINAILQNSVNPTITPVGAAGGLLWFDPATNTAGFDVYTQLVSGGAFVMGPSNVHGTLYTSPDRNDVHLQDQGQPFSSGFHDGNVMISFTFTRVPNPTVRDCYDFSPTSPCH